MRLRRMKRTMDEEPSYKEIFRVYHWLFRALGLLPSSSTRLTILLTVYFHVINMLYYTMHLGPGVRMMLTNYEVDIEYVFQMVIAQGFSTRFLIFHYKSKKLARLIRICENLWQMLRVGEGRIVKDFEMKVRYFMYYFAMTLLSGTIFFNITAQVARFPPAELNGTDRRMLPFRSVQLLIVIALIILISRKIDIYFFFL